MDRDQQELKSIAFWGILKKTFKIINTERMIFAKITLSFILPLTIIILGYPLLNMYLKTTKLDIINKEVYSVTSFVLLTFAGYMLALIFFLPSTSAIVYTIACMYTAKQFTFKTIFLSVVPKAWIRLMATFAIQFLIILAYNFVTILVLIPPILWLTDRGLYILIILAVPYLIGFVYISVIWNLANIVSLLEDLKGYGGIKKSKALLRGKRLITCFVFVLIGLPMVVFQILYILIFSPSCFFYLYDIHTYRYFPEGDAQKEGIRYGWILLTVALIVHVFVLLGLVVQTIFYFSCKSYHHEIIDKSYLVNHLENFLPAAAYIPPGERNVQLKHSDV